MARGMHVSLIYCSFSSLNPFYLALKTIEFEYLELRATEQSFQGSVLHTWTRSGLQAVKWWGARFHSASQNRIQVSGDPQPPAHPLSFETLKAGKDCSDWFEFVLRDAWGRTILSGQRTTLKAAEQHDNYSVYSRVDGQPCLGLP